MLVQEIMEPKVITVAPDSTYLAVAQLLYEHDVSGVPVVDFGAELVGIVSEKDLFRILYPYYQSYYEHPELYADLQAREGKAQEIKFHRVETFMTKKVYTVAPDDPIMKAGALMIAHHINRLPVVEGKKLVGIVTRKMIYRAILKKNFDF